MILPAAEVAKATTREELLARLVAELKAARDVSPADRYYVVKSLKSLLVNPEAFARL